MVHLRGTLLLLGVLATQGACVADVEPLRRILGRLEVPDGLDLGTAQVGDPRQQELVISNPGPGPVRVSGLRLSAEATGPLHRFEVDEAEGWLRAGESMSVEVRLVVQGDTEPLRAVLDVLSDTDDLDNPGHKQGAQVPLSGQGVVSGLEVSPNPVDFGVVPSGTRATAEITLTNTIDAPLTIRTPDFADGRAALYSVEGQGQFEIDAYVAPDGTTPRGRAELQPGESTVVRAHFVGPIRGLGGTSAATWRVAGCEDEACIQTVDLVAETESDAIDCQPEDVDFGQVFPGQARTRPVTCYNRGPVPLLVTAVGTEPSGAEELGVEAVAPTTLDPGASITLQTWFRPTQVTLQRGGEVAAVVRVGVRDPSNGDEGAARVRLFGMAGGARLEIRPNPLDFGEVALGTTRADALTIENVGYDTAIVSAIVVDTDGTGAFTADVTPFEVPRGETVTFPVTFAPNVPGTIRSGIRFVTNDAVTPEHAVGLVGIGLDLQPCMYALESAELQFGAVRVGDSVVRTITIRNTGPYDCLVRDLRIEPPPGETETPFSLEGTIPPTRLTAGQAITVSIRFAPTTAGDHRAWLAFYVSDPQQSNPRVPLFGTGQAPLEITCPPDVTTAAGRPVDLRVLAVGIAAIDSYEWSIVSAPPGGIGTPDQWRPDPPRSSSERFLPFLVGVYTLQATVRDVEGNEASCSVDVTAEGRGLRVTLTWDGEGDVDLHLHRGTTRPWFSDDDCYYANPRPIWDTSWPTSDGANPELDFDNTSRNGPENTRVNVVRIGETYTVSAHNYARAQGRRATIQIFCGGGTMADATFTSRPLVGVESSNCSANDFWKVATVVFDSANSCHVTPIDTYVRSQDACLTY